MSHLYALSRRKNAQEWRCVSERGLAEGQRRSASVFARLTLVKVLDFRRHSHLMQRKCLLGGGRRKKRWKKRKEGQAEEGEQGERANEGEGRRKERREGKGESCRKGKDARQEGGINT